MLGAGTTRTNFSASSDDPWSSHMAEATRCRPAGSVSLHLVFPSGRPRGTDVPTSCSSGGDCSVRAVEATLTTDSGIGPATGARHPPKGSR